MGTENAKAIGPDQFTVAPAFSGRVCIGFSTGQRHSTGQMIRDFKFLTPVEALEMASAIIAAAKEAVKNG